ncbi:PREDICTED: transmembrane protein 2 isoform X2 [Buceros rhinoceros silvestris]|uniref:transmembrane protein 2 isoform X2 n=1 Tax=Buceros rhinoceros silvestris TaxID=175836 RepID=UPI0005285041|nr:PREDICTED: transmembrane protein 2 isoform X2 [Buceros rhinoceros silvestris]
MQDTDVRGSSPAFLRPQNGSSHRSSGYVPGRIVPLRPPPPLQSHAAAEFTSARQEARTRLPSLPADQHRRRAEANRHKNTLICFAMSSLSLFVALGIFLGIASKYAPDENCPDQNPRLKNWSPGKDPEKRVFIKKGDLFRLNSDATVHSIVIQDGGLLVFGDDKEGSKNITLRTRFILIKDGGMLHVGAEKCRYKSKATIILYGKSNEGADVPEFGKKFIGVGPEGTLELHGHQKLSWTLLSKTMHFSGLAYGHYTFEKNFSRGLNVRVIDQDTAEILEVVKFDTHEFSEESLKLQKLLKSGSPGRIVAIAVGDSAAKNLLEETRVTIQNLLGSKFVRGLSYRQAWAFVGVIGGGNSSCNESVRNYENHSTGGKALAQKEFFTVDGQKFVVRAYSEWNDENPQFPHVGEVIDGVDMRAEVGVLTRNILIKGETENTCYREAECQFFNYDTFGGHIKILKNFTSVHLSYVELKQMGQQLIGSYPVHFHRCGDVDEKGGYSLQTYLEGLSIHHCFSRCVTVHATNGLLIKDTIGYDTLGHCFFTEDGIEQRNTLFHNLGLVTKPGTLLPTDRNSSMCVGIRDKVYGSYIPVPATDCMAVSTFWISHPNNHLINNAAAGSQDAGIWYLFHRVATGDSHSLAFETKSELTPLGIFYNNRVHSNFKAGLFIDKGVKTTNASADDPREYLCLDNNARFRPHQDADPDKPRVAALIDRLISFKNNDHGAWVRGGDILIQNSGFADNGIGLTFASDGSFPSDEGASQEVSESLFIGESKNYGFAGGQNKYAGTGGIDNKVRTLPRNRTFPIRGFQIYDGPVHLTKCTFKNFVPTPDRFTSAVGFLMKNPWQMTPKNNISLVKFGPNVSLKAFFGKPGPWFEEGDLDGDKNSIFHDLDGSVTDYKDTYVGRMDNYLIQHPRCINVTEWSGVVCSGTYAQVYVQTWNGQNLSMTIVRDEYPVNPMVLRGINQRAVFQQYQPVVMLQKGYTVHWNGKAPNVTYLYLINFNKNDWIRIGLCYQPNADFIIVLETFQRRSSALSSKVERYMAVSSMTELEKNRSDKKFYFDNSTGLLFLFLQAKYNRDGHSYCSSQGCERIKIVTKGSAKGISNCMAKAYPKYYQGPSVIKRMPVKNTVPCAKCGTTQMVFTSDPHRNYLLVQISSSGKKELSRGQQAFVSVNDSVFSLKDNGILVVVIDACTGIVSGRKFFSGVDIKRVDGYLKSGIPQRSVVLLSTRGDVAFPSNLPEALMSLGTAKPPYLQSNGSLAFMGFRGSFKPAWIKLFTSPAEHGLVTIEKYIPLQLEEYGCARAIKTRRKDLELLKRATQSH